MNKRFLLVLSFLSWLQDTLFYDIISYMNNLFLLYGQDNRRIIRKRNEIISDYSIDEFNTMLSALKYDELVPQLPAESTCTLINNFKDQTPGSLDEYALKINSTDTFHVHIEDYAKATAFYNNYVTALNAKGYTDESSAFGMYNWGLSSSTTGTYVGIDFPTEANYKGYVGIRYKVTKADEQSLRPVQKFNVSASSEIQNGSISFNGTTQYEYIYDGLSNQVLYKVPVTIVAMGPIIGTTCGPGLLATFARGKEVTRFEGDGIQE